MLSAISELSPNKGIGLGQRIKLKAYEAALAFNELSPFRRSLIKFAGAVALSTLIYNFDNITHVIAENSLPQSGDFLQHIQESTPEPQVNITPCKFVKDGDVSPGWDIQPGQSLISLCEEFVEKKLGINQLADGFDSKVVELKNSIQTLNDNIKLSVNDGPCNWRVIGSAQCPQTCIAVPEELKIELNDTIATGFTAPLPGDTVSRGTTTSGSGSSSGINIPDWICPSAMAVIVLGGIAGLVTTKKHK